MKKALIFDIDGTLWDSRRPVAIAWDHIIKQETGKSQGLNAENVSYLFGKPMDEIAALLFPEKTKDQQMALGRKCFDYETEYLAGDPGTLFPNVRQTLETLAKSYPLYIVSNCQCGYIQVFLACTGLSPLFQGHLCFGDTGTSKGKTIRRLMSEHGIMRFISAIPRAMPTPAKKRTFHLSLQNMVSEPSKRLIIPSRHFLIFSPCFRQILCNQTNLLPAVRITLTATQAAVIYLFIGGAL